MHNKTNDYLKVQANPDHEKVIHVAQFYFEDHKGSGLILIFAPQAFLPAIFTL